ncbi:unnamed protein product [Ostreobium quekettii]|uniref:Uncharacterized protein n=1 Tax=Ostreobium quekettii TaxID=121088 RepID=A0A8S1IVI3_9CHLO|nr:unnamed protein product [Ostreobium quekettii]
MEMSISKRESISTKGKATVQRKGPDMTESQQKKAKNDLKRSIRATKKEAEATDSRTEQMDKHRVEVAEQLASAADECKELKAQEAKLVGEIEGAAIEKARALFATAHHQRAAKRFEDLGAGKYKPQGRDAEQLQQELQKAVEKQEKIMAAVRAMAEEFPDRAPLLDRVLLQVVAPSAS